MRSFGTGLRNPCTVGHDGEMTLHPGALVEPMTPPVGCSASQKIKGSRQQKNQENFVTLPLLRWRLGESLSRFKASRSPFAKMSQHNIQKLIRKAHQIRNATSPVAQGSVNPQDLAVEPAANLLEILHARKLRESLARQVTRLEEQSCALSWSIGMAEYEPLYWDASQRPMRDPLNSDEVRSHYLDLLVAVDHLLVQLGDAPRAS